jgi:hypothetical protein
MRLTRRWAVSAGMVLAVFVTTGPVQAHAEDSHWELSESYQYADVGWTLAGHVAGRPGNAHSGYFNFEGDDDGVTAELFDWQCPAGVTPPAYPSSPSSSPCVLKASIWIQQPDFFNTYHFGRTLERNRIQLTVPVEDSLTGGTVDTPIDIRIHGLDPLVRTVSYYWIDTPGVRYRYRDVVLERTADFSGKLAWLNLSNPRLQFTYSKVSRLDTYLQLPGQPTGS